LPAHGKGCNVPFVGGRRQLLFFAVRLPMTHGKESSPCVVRRGARQWEFTVQIATVCSLPCASMKNARQKLCRAFLGLCRAPVAHGKPQVSRSVICNSACRCRMLQRWDIAVIQSVMIYELIWVLG
jgi:hypothetical protein